MADVQAIFGKIGGNAAMMFLKNYDKLRELTSYKLGVPGRFLRTGIGKAEYDQGIRRR